MSLRNIRIKRGKLLIFIIYGLIIFSVLIIGFFSYGPADFKSDTSKFSGIYKKYDAEKDLEFLGTIQPNPNITEMFIVNDLLADLGILEGGMLKPDEKNKSKIAVIIPLRNRDAQLAAFLYHYHPIFKRHKLYYRIFAIVQSQEGRFNRAKLLNVGITESIKYDEYDCFIFHDVDWLIENDILKYGCENSPAHFGVAADYFNYTNRYTFFGGVNAISRAHILSVNGFSNCYWSWGFEDDDIRSRLVNKGYQIYRVSKSLGRFTSNPHNHTTDWETEAIEANRQRIWYSNQLSVHDGLNSLTYTLIKLESFKFYTRLTVNLTGKDNCDEILTKAKHR